MNKPSLIFTFISVTLMMLSGCSSSEEAITIFENVTIQSGLGNYKGMTHGVAWGDYDGDGRPDVYVTNHLNNSALFRNLGDGRFENVTLNQFNPEDLKGDKHGAAWADFDNNGTLDLVQLTGAVMGAGEEPKKLFINTGTLFQESAIPLGVENLLGRTRMPLWVDINNDGYLDLFHGAEARFDNKTPPFVFMQEKNHFNESSDTLPISTKSIPFCIVSELNGDTHPEMICRVADPHRTIQVFDLSSSPAKELDILPTSAFEDIAAADFDNDGKIDIFMARKNPAGPITFSQPGTNELVADITIKADDFSKQAGLKFHSNGFLDFRISSQYSTEKVTPKHVFVGADGIQPDTLEFSLSNETSRVNQISPFTSGQQLGVYIGQTDLGFWPIFISGASKTSTGQDFKQIQVGINIKSSEPITDIEAIGLPTTTEQAPSRLFMNQGEKFTEESEKRGVNNQLVAGVNVVAGDFDNDMNIDLFILNSHEVGKQDNLLLLNQGKGHFKVVSSAGGASGSKRGVGDSVTTVDYNQDGFLDLLIANGASMGRGLGFPSENGDYNLYRNIRNNNHWLEIDLEGTNSNRDAIGAVVKVTTKGITQTRVQDGGIHHRGQNHSRLHFGLANNETIQNIVIQWPSGKIQELSNLNSNQILKIKEQSS